MAVAPSPAARVAPLLSRRRLAWLLCLTGVAWYLAVGHAIHPPTDSMGMPQLGICLVLVTAVVVLVVRRPRQLVEQPLTEPETWTPTTTPAPRPRAAARA